LIEQNEILENIYWIDFRCAGYFVSVKGDSLHPLELEILRSYLTLVAPFPMLVWGLFPSKLLDGNPRLVAHRATGLAAVSTCLSLAVIVSVVLFGPCIATLVQCGPLSFNVYVDNLSSLLLGLVSFLGLVIVRFSRNYLDGDPHQGKFTKWLCLTIGWVMVLVLSGNLIHFALAWSATSWCLHRLLIFYPDRPGALLAARKKFIFSRLGDLCLIGVIFLVYQRFHTWNFDQLFSAAAALHQGEGPHTDTTIQVICYLLVLCALLKSAQFPFHSWLPDTMETPTPVSALMHAGVINAGGFLIVRLSPLITLSPGALAVLAVLGGFTALFASLTMLTHASIKRALAFSTVAQMGFMMLECGLGAFYLAVLHLVAHSLYKAHAFLSSGNIVAMTKSRWVPEGRPQSQPGVMFSSLFLSGTLTLGSAWLFSASPLSDPRSFILIFILLLSQAYMLWNLLSSSLRLSLAVSGAFMGLGISLVYFTLHRLFSLLLASSVAEQSHSWTGIDTGVGIVLLGLFLVVLFFQTQLPQWEQNRFYTALYVHARNGFYFTTLANLFVMRMWPAQMSASRNK
jgi:NAD(P)H-quinone oxidoreductase subunit 5